MCKQTLLVLDEECSCEPLAISHSIHKPVLFAMLNDIIVCGNSLSDKYSLINPISGNMVGGSSSSKLLILRF